MTRRSAAERITYLLEPKNWIIATVVAVGWRAAGVAGLGWGLLSAFFAAGLPTLFITRGVARGRWDDRNVGARRPRLIVLAFILTSVTLGLVVLAALGAPRELTVVLRLHARQRRRCSRRSRPCGRSPSTARSRRGSATILSLMFGPPLTLTSGLWRSPPGRAWSLRTTPPPR